MNLSKLCIQNPEQGNLKGICYICGEKTKYGYKSAISNAFTQFSHLTHGSVACEYCYAFLKERKFRNRSWVANGNDVEFLKSKELRPYILNPPEPPFFIYATQGGQRQGWFDAIGYVNYSREKFYIATDWTPVFIASRKKLLEYDRLVSELREKKLTKTELRTGQWRMHRYRKAIEGNYENLLKEAEKNIGQPAWEVMILVSK